MSGVLFSEDLLVVTIFIVGLNMPGFLVMMNVAELGMFLYVLYNKTSGYNNGYHGTNLGNYLPHTTW